MKKRIINFIDKNRQTNRNWLSISIFVFLPTLFFCIIGIIFVVLGKSTNTFNTYNIIGIVILFLMAFYCYLSVHFLTIYILSDLTILARIHRMSSVYSQQQTMATKYMREKSRRINKGIWNPILDVAGGKHV